MTQRESDHDQILKRPKTIDDNKNYKIKVKCKRQNPVKFKPQQAKTRENEQAVHQFVPFV